MGRGGKEGLGGGGSFSCFDKYLHDLKSTHRKDHTIWLFPFGIENMFDMSSFHSFAMQSADGKVSSENINIDTMPSQFLFGVYFPKYQIVNSFRHCYISHIQQICVANDGNIPRLLLVFG